MKNILNKYTLYALIIIIMGTMTKSYGYGERGEYKESNASGVEKKVYEETKAEAQPAGKTKKKAGSKNLVIMTPIEYRQSKDRILLSIKIDASTLKLSTHGEIKLTPMLKTKERNIVLPYVTIIGRERYMTDKRAAKLNVDRRAISHDKQYAMIKMYGNEPKEIIYSQILPFDESLKDAKLVIEETPILCKKVSYTRQKDIMSQMYLDFNTTGVLQVTRFLSPKITRPTTGGDIAQTKKFVRHVSRFETDIENFEQQLLANSENELKLVFEQGSSNIDIHDANTRAVLNMIEQLTKAKDSRVAKILIGGFTSVEGSYNFNMKLSEARATNMKNYIVEHTDMPNKDVVIHVGGENWIELRAMIVSSDMEYKDEVLYVIDNVKDFDDRESQLMSLWDGEPYQHIQRHFFPKLRVAGYARVYYDDIEGRKVAPVTAGSITEDIYKVEDDRITGASIAEDYTYVRHLSQFDADIKDFKSQLVFNNEEESMLSVSQDISGVDRIQIQQVFDIIDLITISEDSKVMKVLIGGFTSIEGTTASNMKLSEIRANELKAYILSNSSLLSDDIVTYVGGENWIELRTMVASSNMKHKKEVLYIIDNTEDEDEREKILMELKDGAPYRYMQQHIFPKLDAISYVRMYYGNKNDEVSYHSLYDAGKAKTATEVVVGDATAILITLGTTNIANKVEKTATDTVAVDTTAILGTLPVIEDIYKVTEDDYITVGAEIADEYEYVRHISLFDYDMRNFEQQLTEDVYNETTLIFTQGISGIDVDNTKKILEIINEITNSSDSKVAKVLIGGFTSVEGVSDSNTKLSEIRANELKSYILDNSKLSDSDIVTYIGGENWLELKKMIVSSDMEYKKEVLYVMDNVEDADEREKVLMELKDGAPYRYMQEHFFLKLDALGYIRIYYKNKSDGVARTTPLSIADNLTIKENKATESISNIVINNNAL